MVSDAIILARISDARDGDERGVSDQLSDGQLLAQRLRWTVGPAHTHHVIENDTSAFKRKRITLPDGSHQLRTVRPAFRQALAMLGDGRADGLIAYDLDRACRDPRDLEDLIDVIESSRPRIPVESVTGSLKLATDADITMARVLVAVANKSSRDTARRVARARLRQAASGQYGGGKRRYGFERDGATIREDEAAEIRRWADSILAGVSLRQVTASLRDRGVPTATGGAAWDTQTVRDILLRPRNAGLMVHRAASDPRVGPPYDDAEIVGTAPWPAIVPAQAWRAVCAILTDPARNNHAGNTPRWLGSRIYRCGRCDDGTTLVVMGSQTGAKRYSRYTCDAARTGGKWHLARAAKPVDELVEAALIARLERPDAADLIPASGGVDLAALYAEEASLRELLNEQARLHARKVIDGQQLEAGSRELRVDLTRVRAAIAAAEITSPLAGIAGRPDAAQLWKGLDLGRKRALLRVLADVTLQPAVQQGPRFDPDSVDIDFKKKRQ
jgi:site-specific DNA recombinase